MRGAELYVLKILEEYSDESHPLMQKDIIDKLDSEYGCKLNRKTVSSIISLLKDEFDYDIIDAPGRKGYYLGERLLDPTEIKFISDAIFSSPSLKGKDAHRLIKKLNSLLSEHERQNYKFVYKSENVTRTNIDVFFTLSMIEEAIASSKRLKFNYVDYDLNGNEVLKRNKDGSPKIYRVACYYTINCKGNYYLFGAVGDSRSGIFNTITYKIDRIRNPEISTLPSIDKNLVPQMKNFDIDSYINNNVYMISSDVITITIKTTAEGIKTAKEWFGTNCKLLSSDEEGATISIKNGRSSLFYWCMQYSEMIKILSPDDFIEQIINEAQNIIDKHKEKKTK